MGSRFPSHQLSNGLYVSGRPEQPKEKLPTMSSTVMPYTGGDIKKSGELGKMFDAHVENSKSRKSGPITGAPSRTGSFTGVASHSGPIMPNSIGRSSYSGSLSSAALTGSGSSLVSGGSNRQKSNSGPLNRHGDLLKKSSGSQSGGVAPASRQNSGPLAPMLPATGLITSGPISSGPLNSPGAPPPPQPASEAMQNFPPGMQSQGTNAQLPVPSNMYTASVPGMVPSVPPPSYTPASFGYQSYYAPAPPVPPPNIDPSQSVGNASCASNPPSSVPAQGSHTEY